MALALLLLYFTGLYIRPQDWVPFVLGWPIDWLIFGTLLIFLPFQSERLPRLSKSHAFPLLLAWIVMIALSHLTKGELWWARESILNYGRFVIVFASLVVCISTPTDFRRIVWFELVLKVLLAYQCIDMVANQKGWAGQNLDWDDGYGGRARWVGLWDGPNVLCIGFVAAVPYLFQFGMRPWPAVTRVISVLMNVVIVWGILLTQSRGGFVSLGVVVLFSILSRFKPGKGVLLAAVAAVGLAAIAPGRMSQIDDSQGSKSSTYRMEMWSAGLTMARENPLFGVGKMRFREYSARETGKGLIAHNSYIENMAETGFIGLWVFLALAYVTVKGLVALSRRLTDPWELSTVRAMLVAIVGYCATAFFVTADFDLWYVELGLASALCAAHGEFPKLTVRDVRTICAIEIAIVASVYILCIFHFG